MKEIKRNLTIMLLFFIIAFSVIKVSPLFLPIKYSVKEMPENVDQYIIVENEKTTGYEWCIVGNENGLYAEDSQDFRCINLVGNVPMFFFYSDDSPGNNRFICYGEYVYQPYDGVQGHNINGEYVYNVDQWDIMYPIKRDLFMGILISKNYICRYDICNTKGYTFREMLDGLYIWNYKTLPYDK